jgi:hypothetical protein
LFVEPASEEQINQKQSDKYKKIKRGWSVDERINCLPRILMVVDIFIDQFPRLIGVSIGRIQADTAKIADIPIPSQVTNRSFGISHKINPIPNGIMIQIIGELN